MRSTGCIAITGIWSLVCLSCWSYPSHGLAIPALVPRSEQTNTAIYWYTEVTVGKQKFNLTVDTGSSDLWLHSPVVNPQNKHTTYTCDKVTSPNDCVKIGNFSIYYGFGDAEFGASGYVVTDNVTVAGNDVPILSVGVAEKVGWPQAWSPDGFLGLSWHYYNQDDPKQATFSEALIPKLNPKVFAVDFPSIGKQGGKVDLTFGYVNKTKAGAGLRTVNIETKSPKWSAVGMEFGIGNDGVRLKGADNTTVHSQNMIFDTGAGPSILVDPVILRQYFERVKGNNVTARDLTGQAIKYNFPCNTILPDFNLFVNDTRPGIFPGRQLHYHDPDANNMCTSPLQSNKGTVGTGSVGTLFFQNHYVVFDMTPEKPQIQFAPWNGTADATS